MGHLRRWNRLDEAAACRREREFFLTGQSVTEQSQFSNELRYSGTFGPASVTAGLYYFSGCPLGAEKSFNSDLWDVLGPLPPVMSEPNVETL